KLDLQFTASTSLVMAEMFAFLLNLADYCVLCFGAEVEIDETCTGDLNPRNEFRGRQRLNQAFSDRPWVLAQWFCQHHCQVGGEITMVCVFRALKLYIWLWV